MFQELKNVHNNEKYIGYAFIDNEVKYVVLNDHPSAFPSKIGEMGIVAKEKVFVIWGFKELNFDISLDNKLTLIHENGKTTYVTSASMKDIINTELNYRK